MKRFATLTVLGVLVFSLTGRAAVKLPAIFGDHMVVQRDARIPVWGTADAGEQVTVKAAGQERSVKADDAGKWRVVLDPIAETQPIEITVTGNGKPVAIKDVLVGEVWLCSGQSNMVFALKGSTGGEAVVKLADRPTMRLFKVGRAFTDQPQADLAGGKWEVCTPETVADFSAVAYLLGAELQDNLNTPVGLIEPSWGGTRAEAWIPRPTFDALALPYEPAWTERWLNPPPKADGKPDRDRPYQAPAFLFNGMIAPFAGYAIRGAVWYQGETNTAYAEHYGNVLGALIESWRNAWGQGDFPFLVVQLPNFESGERDWPTLRAGQARVAREMPNVGLAVTIDVGESKDIHPKDKQSVAHRLALIARRMVYGQDLIDSGPIFESMNVDGSAVTVRFKHAEGGLVARGGTLQGFEIAGGDGRFVPAVARIEGDTVVVSADAVPSPENVRYGWANDPACTLYNHADLPAQPFSSDKK